VEDIFMEGGKWVAKVIDSEYTNKYLTELPWLEIQAEAAEASFGMVFSTIID
jgi:hypothetical protein